MTDNEKAMTGGEGSSHTLSSVFSTSSPTRILIVRTDRLGDIILTLPMASAIRKELPDARIIFLVREYTKPVVQRSPVIDEVRTIDESVGIRKLVQLFRNVRADIVFFPNPRFDVVLAAFLARIPLRIGTGYRWYSKLLNRRIFDHRKTASYNEAVFNLRMLHTIGIQPDFNELPSIVLDSNEVVTVDEWLHLHIGTSSARFGVLHVGSGGSSKDWPLERFVTLGQALIARWDLSIVLTGSVEDSTRLQSLAEEIGRNQTSVFAGKSLPELAALMSKATIVISNSTGPGHLAAALGTPAIGLFPLPPPLSKERWGFRGRHVANVSPAPIAECPRCQECTCMQRIEVSSVLSEVERLLKNIKRG